jgi:hypothetical protein
LWSRKLYELELPDWFITHAESYYHFHWDRIIRDLQSGEFFQTEFGPIVEELEVPRARYELTGQVIVAKLAAILVVVELGADAPVLDTEALRRSLEHDGFSVDEHNVKLVVREGPVSHQEEESELSRLIGISGLSNAEVIRKHLTDAVENYTDGTKDHSSLGESRNLLQAMVDEIYLGIRESERSKTGLPDGSKNRFRYLMENELLIEDEKFAFESAWSFLSAGSHPGLTPREQARIGLVLSLEFGQILS